MDYLTAAEKSKEWNISSRMVAYYCKAGRIEGAVKKGKTWFIPSYAEKPADKRYLKERIKSAGNSIMQAESMAEIEKIEKADTNTIYHTREVYQYLGFTRETLRYYEEIGLISPKREKYSKYREFGIYDMFYLMEIDFYRKRGFTPVQIKNLLEAENQQDYDNVLSEQKNILKNEIERLQGRLKRLERATAFYDYAADRNGRFEVRTMPEYYVKESIDSLSSFQEYKEKVLKYLNLETEDILSNMVRIVTFDETGYKSSGMYIVMQSPSDKKEKLLLEGGKCLYTTLTADDNDNTVMEKMFVLCHQWAEEHQVLFRGVVYIFIRFVILKEQTDRNYYEIWIPLK